MLVSSRFPTLDTNQAATMEARVRAALPTMALKTVPLDTVLLSLKQTQAARLERTHASGNHHIAGLKVQALRSCHGKAVCMRGQAAHAVPAVKHRRKGLDLGLQPLDQLFAGAAGQAGDVVNGFVAIQLGALAPGVRQAVDDVAADVLQAQLKGLKQPHRPGTDDQCIGGDGR